MTTPRMSTAGTPNELDIRRQLNQARQDLAAAHIDLSVLRSTLQALASDSQVMALRYTELHVAYTELLTHARATAAAAAREELAPAAFITGHLEEIGLLPEPGAVPDQVVAEGLAATARVEGRR
ncbi:hypothetical protein [Actinomadura terrae]|uniref:hypothetical protein n=1 Tax=Actinomadura terrae TaxID=604353 RepID=UPI001FA76767|nr:hypothetical protein [Actinomadura terrae]